MPFATNPLDGRRVYFEDAGGPGAPVVLLGGVLEAILETLRAAAD